MKKYIVSMLFLSVFIFAGCGSKVEDVPVNDSLDRVPPEASLTEEKSAKIDEVSQAPEEVGPLGVTAKVTIE